MVIIAVLELLQDKSKENAGRGAAVSLLYGESQSDQRLRERMWGSVIDKMQPRLAGDRT